MATTELRVIFDELDGFLDQLVAKLALDIHANLVRKPSEGGTPVDTGFARANWIPRIAEPVTSPIGTRPKAPGATFTDDSAAQAGIAELGGYKINLGPVYVSNPVDYIARLNDGSSKQAPAGFVQSAIVKAIVQDSRS